MAQEGQGLQQAILDPELDEDDMDAISIQEKIAKADGRFEADDESGFVFKEIQTALDKLNNEINPNA